MSNNASSRRWWRALLAASISQPSDVSNAPEAIAPLNALFPVRGGLVPVACVCTIAEAFMSSATSSIVTSMWVGVPGSSLFEDAGEHAEGQHQPAAVVEVRRTDLDRRAAVEPGCPHRAGHGLHDVVEAWPPGVRALVAERTERAVHDGVVACRHGIPAETHRVGRARREPLDEHVGPLDEPEDDLDPVG